MSSVERFAAAVRMMMPPGKPFSSRKPLMMPRSRLRSSRESILRETPIESSAGMKTRKRPGTLTCEVMRAPLVPSGSFTTCTSTSCPPFRRFSIFWSALFWPVARTRPDGLALPPLVLLLPLPLPSGASSSLSADSSRSNSSIVSTTSET